MPKGSFTGLYTFQEVTKIYGMDNSTLRKYVYKNKFVLDVEVKKFGRTWVITEQAMLEHFGKEKFIEYISKI